MPDNFFYSALTQVTDDCSSNGPGRPVEMAHCIMDEFDWGGTFMRGNPQLKGDENITLSSFPKIIIKIITHGQDKESALQISAELEHSSF